MKLPTYNNKDVCIEYCRFSPSIINSSLHARYFRIFRNYPFSKSIPVSNGLGPHHNQQFVWPDLDLTFSKISSRRQKSPLESSLTLNAPISAKVICFSRLLKCLRSLYGKQYGARSDCSYRSSLFWVHAVCFYT